MRLFIYRYSVKVIPILVGAVNAETEAMYGQLLARYVDDPANFFSVSSDFCHWGSRYVLSLAFLLLMTFALLDHHLPPHALLDLMCLPCGTAIYTAI